MTSNDEFANHAKLYVELNEQCHKLAEQKRKIESEAAAANEQREKMQRDFVKFLGANLPVKVAIVGMTVVRAVFKKACDTSKADTAVVTVEEAVRA